MINTLIIAGLVFALLCVAAWYEGKDERRKAKQSKQILAMWARMKTPPPFDPPWFETGRLRPSYYLGFSRRDITLVSTKIDNGIELTATMRIPRMNFDTVDWRYTYPPIKNEVNDECDSGRTISMQ